MKDLKRVGSILMGGILLFSITSCEKDEPEPIDIHPFYKERSGDAAHELLFGEPYKRLMVEIIHEPGSGPEGRAMDTLKEFLRNRVKKEEIKVLTTEIPSQGGGKYSVTDLKRIEDEHRNAFSVKDDQMAVSFLFLDGGYSEDTDHTQTLGLAYYATSMAIFSGNIESLTGGVGEPPEWKLEAMVLQHEIAHNFGLVDNGTEMMNHHKDSGHGKHCEVEDCLMYYTVETSDFVANLVGEPIPDLDAQCVDDLQANGGK